MTRTDCRLTPAGALLLVAMAAAACGGPPDATRSAEPSSARPSAAGSSTATVSPPESASAVASVGPTLPAIALPEPGHPLTAQALLEGMRVSRRPGGVPDTLETGPIVGAIADQLWTFDGSPWATWSVGGACGPSTCSLEVGGALDGALGEDLYVFSVDPSTAAVQLTEASLGGTPAALVDDIDAAARRAWQGDLSGMALASVAWQPPPDDGSFVLTYRSGGEEGSPGVTIILDVPAGTAEAG